MSLRGACTDHAARSAADLDRTHSDFYYCDARPVVVFVVSRASVSLTPGNKKTTRLLSWRILKLGGEVFAPRSDVARFVQ